MMASSNERERRFNGIAELNPSKYSWRIRAMVERKRPLQRRSTTGNVPTKPMSLQLILVDDQCNRIKAAFWDEMAERMNQALQEGKVYDFGNFAVKQDDTNYRLNSAPFQLNFTQWTDVEEAHIQDTSPFCPQFQIMQFESIGTEQDRKDCYHVLGIVRQVHPCIAHRRKTDGEPCSLQQVVMVNRRWKKMRLVLWGEFVKTTGSKLERICATENAVLVATDLRLEQFNGIQLSTTWCSRIYINPAFPEAQELKKWYDLIGQYEEIIEVDEGVLPSKYETNERILLAEMEAQQSNREWNDSEYHTTICTIVHVPKNRPLSYLSNPENGWKVIELNGGYYCEKNKKIYSSSEQRYKLSVLLGDVSTRVWANVFDSEAKKLLGITAEALEKLKIENPLLFTAYLHRVVGRQIIATIKSTKYTFPDGNETRIARNLVHFKDICYQKESRRLLDEIECRSRAAYRIKREA